MLRDWICLCLPDRLIGLRLVSRLHAAQSQAKTLRLTLKDTRIRPAALRVGSLVTRNMQLHQCHDDVKSHE